VSAAGSELRALKAVLGTQARVAARRELQRRRSRRSVAVELSDGARFVVKYDDRAERVAQEASRLATANRLDEIDTPRLHGATRHYLVQDFVAGEGLDALARRLRGEPRLRLFERAATVLAAIHGSRAAAASLDLSEPCAPARLAERVWRAWREIETRGFPCWEDHQGPVPASWRRAFDEQAGSRLVSDLAATGEAACVLGHGDFQARHLIQTPDDRLFVVDWIAMAWLCPWVELAHLLRWLTPAERSRVTAAYLEAAQKRGLLREVSGARSAALAESGLRYDHLIVAKQMVRKLASTPQPGHLRSFRSSLDALAESAC
jgi:hypothetical protein